MAKRTRRKNEQALVWVRALGIGGATYAGLVGMQFRPGWGAMLLAVAAGLLSIGSVDLGVAVAVLCLAVPVVAADPVIGIAFALLAVVSVRYLGADGGRVFLLLATALLGALFGPVWTVVVIAGFLMGATEGAIATAAACVTVEAAGLALGSEILSPAATVAGAPTPLISFADAPASLFSAQWVPDAFSRASSQSVEAVGAAISGTPSPAALVIQPLIWALGAVATALLVQRFREHGVAATALAASAGALVPAVCSVLLLIGFDIPVAWGPTALAAVSSAVLGGLFVAGYQIGFPVLAEKTRSSVATEDAEVDELLRLIANAEEKLATQHTTTRVVMITDMKSFARMAEEEGSIATAKAIQRHRDLLLPVIETHRGHGKSTGGDGLVAAFDTPFDALEAARAMQRTLRDYNAAHHGEPELSVRIGAARGEVVLDKSGRPFIGAGLNLAARIMNMADGGQIYAAGDLLSIDTSALEAHSHGEFDLKNISKPVEVAEVLWDEGQVPVPPEKHTANGE